MRQSQVIHRLLQSPKIIDEILSCMSRTICDWSHAPRSCFFRLLEQGSSTPNLELRNVLYRTMDFQFLAFFYIHSIMKRYVTLHVSHSIFMVYSTLLTPPWGPGLLIIMWKTLSKWQVKEQTVHRETLDSNRLTGEYTDDKVRRGKLDSIQKERRKYHGTTESVDHRQERRTHRIALSTVSHQLRLTDQAFAKGHNQSFRLNIHDGLIWRCF